MVTEDRLSASADSDLQQVSFVIDFIMHNSGLKNTFQKLNQMLDFLKKIFGAKDDTKLSELVNNGAFLVDVRTPQEFNSGHVKGSVNIPLDTIQNQLSKFKNKENIVVFCRSGMRSTQAKSILNQNGFNNITNGGTWNNINSLLSK